MPASITLKSPPPVQGLLFDSMTVSAGLSMLGEMQLALVSEKPDIKPEDLLGKPVTVTVQLRDDAKRHFHGYVTRFGIGVRRGRYFGYQASVRPWLWFLTRTADCRIFQDQTVPDIVKKVFEDHSNANFEFKLFRSYRKWVYCVQYRESDYNFIARLLEHEGIYWYIEHDDGNSKVVLVDSQSAHDAAPGCKSLPCYEDAGDAPPDIEYVSEWSFASEVETDKVELTSYDFERPSTSLKVDAQRVHKYKVPTLEIFDFQGDYVQASDGSQRAEDRLDEHQTQFQMGQGVSNAHGIEVGRLLSLTRHPRDDQNAEYLLTQLTIAASTDGYESAPGVADMQSAAFDCRFTVIPSKQQFRPRRQTPKPVMRGPQTARVVGPGDIHTDKYGRIKVQFYWDRYGKRDHDSSCWIRVSQSWGGKGWGGMFIPHVGQEVIVEFLEGDPDQPLVTGRVYNAENMPPMELPGNKTKSIIRDHGGNQIRMEGAKGSEQLHLYSPFGKTKLSLGAPNQGPGVLISTEEEMKIMITKLVDQKFDADYKKQVKGKEDKKNEGDVMWKFFANHDWQIQGNTSQYTAGHNTSVVRGTSNQLVVGLYDETFLGAKVSTAMPFQIEWTRGFKINKAVAENVTITPSDLWKLTKSVVKGEFLVHQLKEAHLKAVYSGEIVDEKDVKFKYWKAVSKKLDMMISGDTLMKVDGKYNVTSEGEINLECSGGHVSVKSSSEIVLDAPKITATIMKVKKSLDIASGNFTVSE